MEQFTHLKPLSNKITINKIAKSDVSSGGIIKTNVADEPEMGEVLAVGRGIPLINDAGAFAIIPMEVEVGMKVLFPPNVAVEVELPNGEKQWLITEERILGILS